MVKNISIVIASLATTVTLVGSWTHFYAEQRINTTKISILQRDKRDLASVVHDLNKNQATLIQTVSNNTRNVKDLREDVKDVLRVLSKNQVLIARIAGKIGADSD